MVNVYVVLWLLFAHWFADFVCQPDEWARNKSKYSAILFQHVFLYSTLMAVAFSFISVGLAAPAIFFIVTFICHFSTDFVTSRITSKLAKKEEWHNFFVVIGIDQFLHSLQILLTLYYLTRS